MYTKPIACDSFTSAVINQSQDSIYFWGDSNASYLPYINKNIKIRKPERLKLEKLNLTQFCPINSNEYKIEYINLHNNILVLIVELPPSQEISSYLSELAKRACLNLNFELVKFLL